MRHLSLACIYVSFFGLIGFAVWWTDSAVPLWALLLTPQYKSSSGKPKEPPGPPDGP